MDEREKRAFLKKFGYSGSCVAGAQDELTGKKKEKKDTRVEKADLIALARKFNVHPGPQKKQETLTEFLKKEGEDV